MTKLRVHAFSISLDGYGAGPDQTLEQPMGAGGENLHKWFLPTRTFRAMQGKDDGETGMDEKFAARSFENLGAWIMGRNMFAHSRGPWTDDGWKGWWGKNPPYHVPVYVLTHYPREPLEMEGGTVFHFVTDGIHSALDQAKRAAKGKDIRLGGGTATVREYLKEGLIDELHLAISPTLLGSGEHLLSGIDLTRLGYRCVEHVPSALATHVVLAK
jgi:dihydrofolate reductase